GGCLVCECVVHGVIWGWGGYNTFCGRGCVAPAEAELRFGRACAFFGECGDVRYPAVQLAGEM
ncbi:MAG: hypothetical protein KAH86_09335, partial [Methanosarcinales archaeon]|nr:hypothetical protein [Methanosarcinales archaeon]